MTIKQLSIFLENQRGSLVQVLEILDAHNINILALSLADTEEYGMVRMIVSAPLRARDVLREQGISAHIVEVVALKVSHQSGSLYKTLKLIANCADIEYMYAFSVDDMAYGIIKVNDSEMVKPLVTNGDIDIWTEEEVYEIEQR